MIKNPASWLLLQRMSAEIWVTYFWFRLHFTREKITTSRKKSTTSHKKSTNQVKELPYGLYQQYHFFKKKYQLLGKFCSQSTRAYGSWIHNYLYTKTSNTNTLQSKYIALTHKRNITNSNKLQAIVLNKLWSVWTVNVLKCTILKSWIWRTARSQCFLNNMMR